MQPDSSRSPWVLGKTWWYLPVAAAVIGGVCGILFAAVAKLEPDLVSGMLINTAFVPAGYAFVVLLAPGFQFKHLATAILLQFLAPLWFGFMERPHAPWMIAQWMVTGTLLLLYRVIVVPKWRHERFRGRVRPSFSIGSLLALTLVVALAIVILQVAQMAPDFYWIVLLLCGPPILGWLCGLVMTAMRLRYVCALVCLAGCVLLVLSVLDARGVMQFGFEIEPLWMVASATSTMIVTSSLHIPFQLSTKKPEVGSLPTSTT